MGLENFIISLKFYHNDLYFETKSARYAKSAKSVNTPRLTVDEIDVCLKSQSQKDILRFRYIEFTFQRFFNTQFFC